MNDSSKATPPANAYYYKDKPLEHSYNNNYTKEEKLEIILQIERDFNAGMISISQLTWIYENKMYGSFSAGLCLDKLMKKNILKRNPITGDKRLFNKEKSKFDW